MFFIFFFVDSISHIGAEWNTDAQYIVYINLFSNRVHIVHEHCAVYRFELHSHTITDQE